MRLAFRHDGRDYVVVRRFDGFAALSALPRMRTYAAYMRDRACEDMSTPADGFTMWNALCCINRETDEGDLEPLASDEFMHGDLNDADYAVGVFEEAAQMMACAQLRTFPIELCGMA